MNKFILFTALLFLANFSFAGSSKVSYHKVTLKDGEGLSVLMSKYDLFNNKENINKFYSINNINAKTKLIKNKKYLLPITIHKYNNQSIKSTLQISDLDLVTDIKNYNEKLANKGLKKSYKSDGKIWVPAHLEVTKSGTKNEKPVVEKKEEKEDNEDVEEKEDSEYNFEAPISKSGNGTFKNVSLFGPKYGKVNMFDNRLKGQVFYLSSGHGGPDSGAQCTDLDQDLCEDEYAYDVTLRLARDLTQHGATVHVIIQDKNDGIRDGAFLDCDRDETCNGKKLPLRQLDRLKQRADHINRLYSKYKKQGVKKQTAIMIHVDSKNQEQRQDVFFYHYGDDKRSKDLAYGLKSTFEDKYEIFQKGRGYKGYVANRGLYMLRKVNSSAVYVELANIKNKSDHIRLMESANRQALANWLFEGLTDIK
jgi:N-acetylmuramoyl-L-alanine amidase